jgi:hypothetical protein
VIQVVDRAKPPDRKSGPARTLITLCAGFIALATSLAYVAIRHSMTILCSVAEHREDIAALRAAVRLRPIKPEDNFDKHTSATA